MDLDDLPQKIVKPKFMWNDKFWFGLISYYLGLIGVLYFFFPSFKEHEFFVQYRNLIVIILFLLPYLPSIIIWFVKFIIFVVKRTRDYAIYYDYFIFFKDEYDNLRKQFFKFLLEMPERKVFTINKASFIQGKIYVSIGKHVNQNLNTGDFVSLLHKEETKLMGIFKIIDILDNEYNAVGTSNIDPIFGGYIRKEGTLSIVPNIVAVRLSQGERNGNK